MDRVDPVQSRGEGQAGRTSASSSANRPLIVYHASCMDGLVAAYIAWRHYGENAGYIEARYGDAPPPQAVDRDVFVLDFSYDPNALTALAGIANRVVLLDHHASAIAAFHGSGFCESNVQLLFDLSRSGAALAEAYFNGSAPLWIVQYVEDRDLWRFELPHSHEINAYLAASVMGRPALESFRMLDEIRGMSLKDVVSGGHGAQLQLESYVRQVVQDAVYVDFADHKNIPMVNCAKHMASDVLNKLAENHLFAVGWRSEGRDRAVFSLRSKDYDVAQIAERYGGGGHKRAAGMTLALGAVQHFLGTAS